MSFSIEKFQVLYKLKQKRSTITKCAQCAKDLGVKIASNLKFSQHCNDAANIENRILGFIERNFSFKNKDTVLPFNNSIVRPRFKYAVQFWFPHLVKDIAKLESVIFFYSKGNSFRAKTKSVKKAR